MVTKEEIRKRNQENRERNEAAKLERLGKVKDKNELANLEISRRTQRERDRFDELIAKGVKREPLQISGGGQRTLREKSAREGFDEEFFASRTGAIQQEAQQERERNRIREEERKGFVQSQFEGVKGKFGGQFEEAGVFEDAQFKPIIEDELKNAGVITDTLIDTFDGIFTPKRVKEFRDAARS